MPSFNSACLLKRRRLLSLLVTCFADSSSAIAFCHVLADSSSSAIAVGHVLCRIVVCHRCWSRALPIRRRLLSLLVTCLLIRRLLSLLVTCFADSSSSAIADGRALAVDGHPLTLAPWLCVLLGVSRQL